MGRGFLDIKPDLTKAVDKLMDKFFIDITTSKQRDDRQRQLDIRDGEIKRLTKMHNELKKKRNELKKRKTKK